MNINTKLDIIYATDVLAKSKPGTCGLLKQKDGVVYFLGFGMKHRRVLKLWLKIGDQCYDEKTFDHHLIMRKSNKSKNRPAWFVLAREDWKELCNSEDMRQEVRCIAVLDLTKTEVQNCVDPNIVDVPFCLRAEFNSDCAAVAFARDPEICRMWISECNAMCADEYIDVGVKSKTIVEDQVSQVDVVPMEKPLTRANREGYILRNQNRPRYTFESEE